MLWLVIQNLSDLHILLLNLASCYQEQVHSLDQKNWIPAKPLQSPENQAFPRTQGKQNCGYGNSLSYLKRLKTPKKRWGKILFCHTVAILAREASECLQLMMKHLTWQAFLINIHQGFCVSYHKISHSLSMSHTVSFKNISTDNSQTFPF